MRSKILRSCSSVVARPTRCTQAVFRAYGGCFASSLFFFPAFLLVAPSIRSATNLNMSLKRCRRAEGVNPLRDRPSTRAAVEEEAVEFISVPMEDESFASSETRVVRSMRSPLALFSSSGKRSSRSAVLLFFLACAVRGQSKLIIAFGSKKAGYLSNYNG